MKSADLSCGSMSSRIDDFVFKKKDWTQNEKLFLGFNSNADVVLYEGDCLNLLSQISRRICQTGSHFFASINLGKALRKLHETGRIRLLAGRDHLECVRTLDKSEVYAGR